MKTNFSYRAIAAAATVALAGLFNGAAGAQPTTTVFSVPGGDGTYPAAVNDKGTVTGDYTLKAQLTKNSYTEAPHGFVRAADGTITKFDPSGALFTEPNAIARDGTIVGTFYTGKSIETAQANGFIRAPSGAITEFDIARAHEVGTSPTNAFTINSLGEVAGTFCPSKHMCEGFIRISSGQTETFFAHQGTGSSFTAGSVGLNSNGDFVGTITDTSSGPAHGFIRDGSGNVTLFDAPHAGTGAGQGTYAASINDNGLIAGSYVAADSGVHGYLRYPGGHFVEFDAPYATSSGPSMGTFVSAMNRNGTITGFWTDNYDIPHGFNRLAKGQITSFQVPAPNATWSNAISDTGIVTGYVINNGGNSGFQGFVMTGN